MSIQATSDPSNTETNHHRKSWLEEDLPRHDASEEIGFNLASTSSVSLKPKTPPACPLKRPWNTTGLDSSSDQGPSSHAGSSRPNCDASSSPSKRRKREVESGTLESARPPKKQVFFHPSTEDNWRWADLFRGKYKGEGHRIDDTSQLADPAQPTSLFLPADSCQPVNSPGSGQPGVPAQSVVRADAADKAPSNSGQIPSSPVVLPSPLPSPAAVVLPGPRPSVLPLPRILKLFPKRREISFCRAKEFLTIGSWANRFSFLDRTSDDEPDSEEDTLDSFVEDSEVWPPGDCDDVSVPRSSPLPSVRIAAMDDLSTGEANRLQRVMDGKRRRDATVKLPTPYPPSLPTVLGDDDDEILADPADEKPEQDFTESWQYKAIISTVETLPEFHFLMGIFNKLSEQDSRRAKLGLVKVLGQNGRVYYEKGVQESMRKQQSRITQKPGPPSAS